MAVKAVHVQNGAHINYLNSGVTTLTYGDVVVIGKRIGVVAADIAAGLNGVVHLDGVWTLPAVTDAAFSVGDQLFWDAQNEVMTKVAAGNAVAGICVLAKLQATATANVLFAPVSEADARMDALETAQGTLSNLGTTEKANLVGAINEVNTNADAAATAAGAAQDAADDVADDVGDITTLTTTAKDTVVAAINELVSRVATLEAG